MSGISSVTQTPAYTPSAPTPGPGAPTSTAAALTASPAAGDSVSVAGSGQAASGDLEMFRSVDVTKDVAPPLPPVEQPQQTAAPEIKPYEAPPVHDDTLKKPQPIKNTHFSIIEGPASPDP